MRLYNEDVQVRCGFDGPARLGPQAPQAFVWRGRSYVVRAVLDRWVERRPWWRAALDPEPGHPAGGVVHDVDEDLWRGEGSPGRGRATGVFDLAHASSGASSGAGGGGSGGENGGWRLRRMLD